MTVMPRHRRTLASALIALTVIACALLAAPRASAALDPGSNAVVRADGDCLRMRAQPSLQGTLLACVPDGSIVSVLAGSVAVDGFQWQRISFAGQIGWSVEIYLQPSGSAPPPVVTAAPPPAATTPPTTPTSPLPTPALTGSLPSGGGFSLAVWSGGPIDRMPPVTAQRGCTLRAVWVTSGGDFVGYVYGAPNIVNAAWNALYPDNSLAANTAVIVVCAAAGSTPPPSTSPPPASQPPAGPVATPGVPPGTPSQPPGPAGNR
ncbi:MAG: hypothetical protein WC211_07655 [Dehalococcoidia bacterium]